MTCRHPVRANVRWTAPTHMFRDVLLQHSGQFGQRVQDQSRLLATHRSNGVQVTRNIVRIVRQNERREMFQLPTDIFSCRPCCCGRFVCNDTMFIEIADISDNRYHERR